jgi:hypothetical protein
MFSLFRRRLQLPHHPLRLGELIGRHLGGQRIALFDSGGGCFVWR